MLSKMRQIPEDAMKRALHLGMLALIIAMVSGRIFRSDDKKEEKKGAIKGKVSLVITEGPLSGVSEFEYDYDLNTPAQTKGSKPPGELLYTSYH
jgi:hypothetical protein